MLASTQMPIPSQNEILLPFLRRLVTGDPITRGSLLKHIVEAFRITPEEAERMSGPHNTLMNRLVWCDVYFVKAGFVTKKKHPTTTLGDEFTITAKGRRELRYNAERISVGYLQSFYNGRVYRGAGSDDTTSEAELELYHALESLPKEFTIFHSVRWIAKNSGTVGETDFIIAHPQFGLLVLEVKGGEISIERKGNDVLWISTSRIGKVSTIADPCKQAERNRRALHDWLENDARTKRFKYAIFPAVAFPDSQVTSDLRPDCTKEMFIDISHLQRLEARIREIYEYWTRHADHKNSQMDGKPAIDALVDMLVPSRKLQPKIAEVFARERRRIDELTLTQYRILRQLKSHNRAAIIGGAGTGKTMLAIEKAAQLADENKRVLFLCFNRNLMRWIAEHINYRNVNVFTFHSFVSHLMDKAGVAFPPSKDEFFQHIADYLMQSLDLLKQQNALEHHLPDAIIIDEAQDFEDVWWVPISEMLKSEEDSILYVFFDDNQRIYRQLSSIPIEGRPFYLDENCRNTRSIHRVLESYMVTEDEIICNGPEGRQIEVVSLSRPGDAVTQLSRTLHNLTMGGVEVAEIVMLTPASEKRSQWKSGATVGAFTLSWDLETSAKNTLRVCSIHAFKGLESAVVILSELNMLPNDERRNPLLYVAISRARNHVIVLGDLPR